MAKVRCYRCSRSVSPNWARLLGWRPAVRGFWYCPKNQDWDCLYCGRRRPFLSALRGWGADRGGHWYCPKHVSAVKQKEAEIRLPAKVWAAALKERKDYHGLAAAFPDNASYEDSTEWNGRRDAAKAVLLEAKVDAIAPIQDVLQSFGGRSDDLTSLLKKIQRDLK